MIKFTFFSKSIHFREKVSFFTPKKYKESLKKQMIYAGIKDDVVDKFIGFSFFFSIFLGVTIAFDLFLIGMGLNGILLGLGAGVAALVLIQIIIILVADARADAIETVLPDVLQLMAANVRAGMTVDRAIWLAARPEFGVFEEELRRAGAKTIGGKTLKVALMEMTSRVNSDLLDKTFRLVIEGIESGGELSHLLEETAANARTIQSLRKEIKSSVTTYSIFIFFAAALGAPALYAISLFFVEIMTKLWAPSLIGGGTTATSSTMGGGMLSKAGAPTITEDQLFWFAITSITLTTVFGSMIIGLIQSGKEKSGLKLIPIMTAMAIGVLLFCRYLITVVFGSFFAL